MTTTIVPQHLGTSCPWRIPAPADLTPIARTLESARTRPHVRAMLAAEAAATTPEPVPPAPADREEVRAVHVPVTRHDDGSLMVAGYRITAPAFTSAEQFDAALGRAFADGIRIEPADRPDCWLAVNPATGASYTTSRTSCSCLAGRHGTPCKHEALVCFLADVAHELEVA